MMGNYGYGGGMGWFGGLMMLLSMAALIVLIVWAVRAFFPTPRRDERDTTLAILQWRYAAGEISAAEYERARRVLGEAEPAAPPHGSN
jgi:uncharacterized membrane protein